MVDPIKAQRSGSDRSLSVPAPRSSTTPQIAMAAHDLRATLARIRMVVELIQDELADAAPASPAGARRRIHLAALEEEVRTIESRLQRLVDRAREPESAQPRTKPPGPPRRTSTVAG